MKHIREATDAEVSDMTKELKTNLLNKYYWSLFGDDYFTELAKDNDGYGRKYMAILDDCGNVAGLVQISRKSPRSLAVLAFVVYERAAGNGYGTRAIEEILGVCRDIGINNILIDTTTKKLRDYYKKFGFVDVGCFKGRVPLPDGKLHDKYYLQLIL